jgi:hypothetical protein
MVSVMGEPCVLLTARRRWPRLHWQLAPPGRRVFAGARLTRGGKAAYLPPPPGWCGEAARSR